MAQGLWAGVGRVVGRVERSIDRVTGADSLKPHVRQQLLAEHLRVITHMGPLLFVGTLLTSAVFLFVTYGKPAFDVVFWWAIVVNMLYGACFYIWWRDHEVPRLRLSARTNMVLILLCCFLSGALWGIAPNLLPIAEPSVRAAAIIGVGGMMSISALALCNLPQGVAAFLLPLAIGATISVARLSDPLEMWVQTLLLGCFVVVMLAMALRHGRAFVQYRASRSQVDEKKEIIALLLKEFEATASDWVWGFDREGRIDNVSKGFTSATGLPPEDLIGADFVHFLHCIAPPNDTLMAQLERDFEGRETFADVELRVTAGGAQCWWRLSGKPIFDHRGDYVGYVGTVTDISARRAAEEQMTALAHRDALTGLLNRAKFSEHLGLCVSRLARYGSPFALLYIDLDEFKAVNDSRGHLFGDRLLIQVAARIHDVLRETDIAARLGGDEFAVLLTTDCARDMCAAIASRIVESIKRPFDIDGDTITIGGSVGLALAPDDGSTADEMLRNADMALYRAKADGRSAFRFFESRMDEEERKRRALEEELREALGAGELMLHYQPLVSAIDRQPMGFEALIRWHHPIRGVILPSEFIPMAEQNGQIIEIGNWTIEQACRAAANWPDDLTVSVNLSVRHFREADIAAVVRHALSVSGLAPERLELEVTEALLVDDIDAVLVKLNELRDLGIRIALDDFGTGYSSLAYLLKFAFDKVKIDHSLIEAAPHDPVARDLLRAIASIGKTLKLRITAEGIETREQAEFISEMLFYQLQGFYFAKPLDAIGLPHYLLTQVRSRGEDVRLEAQHVIAGLSAAG